jgi:predicted Zn-dependent protease
MVRSDVALNEKLQYADYFSQLYPSQEDANQVESIVEKIGKENSNQPGPSYWMASHYLRKNEYQKSLDVLSQWIAQNPDDKNAASQFEQIKQFIANAKQDTAAADSASSDSLQN